VSSWGDLQEALDLKRSGRLDEAVIALESALARSPSNAVALAHLAEVQLRRRRLADAADALERAEALAGTTAFTARVRGDLRYRERRWRDAARCYADADVLGDRGTWSLVQLARCHLRLGEMEAARGAASRAAERDAADASAWVVLGEVALREGREDDAVHNFEQAHERSPGDEFAYAKLIEARVLRLPPEDREREVEVLLRSHDQGNRHLMGVLARLRSDGGDDRHGAIGRDRQDAVDRVPPSDLRDSGDVGEVDRLGDIRYLQPRRVRIPVDGDDPHSELLRAQDRAALMPAGTDEEDRGHRAMLSVV